MRIINGNVVRGRLSKGYLQETLSYIGHKIFVIYSTLYTVFIWIEAAPQIVAALK